MEDKHESEDEMAAEQAPNVNDTLQTMNANMSNMTSLIEKLVERQSKLDDERSTSKNTTKRWTQNVMSDSDTESEEYESPIRKRARIVPENDDTVSLYAHDDLDVDANTLEKISKVTDQETRKSADFFKSLVENFDEEDEATGDNVNEDLAHIAKKRWGKKLTSDKIKGLVEKYKCPQNCPDLKSIKVNPEIWAQIDSHKRKSDLNHSNIQQMIRKITVATLEVSNLYISGKMDDKTMSQHTVNVIAMLAHTHSQLSQLRRDNIRPALKQEYKTICSTEPTNSNLLFGDELSKKLKDAREASRIGRSLTKTNYKGKTPYEYKHRNFKGQKKPDFLWHSHGRHNARKRPNNNSTNK